jgi:putative metallohydrolase (TIGR04338 family)
VTREQQLAVYAAEDAALAGLGRVFPNVTAAQRYVDGLVAGDWWASRWPQVDRVAVGRSRSRRFAGYALTGITPEVRLSSLSEAVVLHELAHTVAGGDHGPAFVEALLALVRHQMGFHAYGALRAELEHSGG